MLKRDKCFSFVSKSIKTQIYNNTTEKPFPLFPSP